MLPGMAAERKYGIDGGIELLRDFREAVAYDDLPESGRAGPHHQQGGNNQQRNELHQHVRPEVARELPPKHAADSADQQYRKKIVDARMGAILNDEREQSHEDDGHGQAIPYQSSIVGRPVIKGGAEGGEKDSAEQDPGRGVFQRSQAENPNESEGSIGDNVPEIGYSQERSPVGEMVIILVLVKRREQQ